jgi:tetratricopeptide (TPR) repeat protein
MALAPRVLAGIGLWMLFLGSFALAQLGADDYFFQCRSLYARGDLSSAKATCELALTANPQHVPSLELLSRIHLDEKQIAEAEQSLEQLRGIVGADNATLRLLQARLLLLRGRPAEALGVLPSSRDPESYLYQGVALEALGRYEEAYNAYRRADRLLEGRLGAGRMARRLGQPTEGIFLLRDSPREDLLRGELLWSAGRLQEAAEVLEPLLSRFSRLDEEYTQALKLLTAIHYGTGNLERGGAYLSLLSQQVSLPTQLLSHIWPWLAVFVLYLALILIGESRIEPMRTVELDSQFRLGPGTVHGWLILAPLIAGALTAGIGYFLYGNWLAAFTPVQAETVRPMFYLLLGAVAFLIAYLRIGLANLHLGARQNWIEGVWAGVVLLAIVGIYGLIRKPLGLGEFPSIYISFLGLAMMEPVLRGAASFALRDRYRELSTYMLPLLSGLAIFGPTLLGVGAAVFLGWLRRRTGGTLAGMVAWVVAGLILTLVAELPFMRTLL